MKAGDICNREVIFASRDTAVQVAARFMRQYHVGSLVVVDEVSGKRIPAGMLTDRDIVIEVIAVDLDPRVITVGDIMSTDIVVVDEGMGVLETLEVMRSRGVRRIPVVDRDGHLAGIVAADDLLEVLVDELTGLTRIASKEQAREVRTRR